MNWANWSGKTRLLVILAACAVLLLCGGSFITVRVDSGTAPTADTASVKTVETGVKAADIKELTIRGNNSNITVTTGNVDCVTLELTNFNDTYTYNSNFGMFDLDLGSMASGLLEITLSDVSVIVPRSAVLSRIDISAGSGNVYFDGVDAGSIRVRTDSGYIGNSGTLSGSADVSTDNGNINLTLKGAEEGYSISADTDYGSVSVGMHHGFSKSFHFEGAEYSNTNVSGNRIQAHTDYGDINIDFN